MQSLNSGDENVLSNDSLEIDLCDFINDNDMLAIRTADENFPYYVMKSTTGVVQLRKAHVDKWGSEFRPGDKVIHGYYYEQVGNDFLHQRLVKHIKTTVPAKSVIYICSEMVATDTFVMQDSLHGRILRCI